jgi:hypothetical protein
MIYILGDLHGNWKRLDWLAKNGNPFKENI